MRELQATALSSWNLKVVLASSLGDQTLNAALYLSGAHWDVFARDRLVTFIVSMSTPVTKLDCKDKCCFSLSHTRTQTRHLHTEAHRLARVQTSTHTHMVHSHADSLEELRGEEVVADVAGAEGESPVRVAALGRLERDLAVLYHLVDAVHFAHDAHRLSRERLLNHLYENEQTVVFRASVDQCTQNAQSSVVSSHRTWTETAEQVLLWFGLGLIVSLSEVHKCFTPEHNECCTRFVGAEKENSSSLASGPSRGRGQTHLGAAHRLLVDAEPEEGGVRHLDEDVVHAVHVQVLDSAVDDVVQDSLVPQRAVQAPITIWCGGGERQLRQCIGLVWIGLDSNENLSKHEIWARKSL